MVRTTIFAEPDLLQEIKEISREKHKPASMIIREAMQDYVLREHKKKPLFSFTGIGSSGRKTVADHHEKLLWKKA
jgi:metal-responsive CopG/Arc/MetJ family transcriptional regulator